MTFEEILRESALEIDQNQGKIMYATYIILNNFRKVMLAI